jgi:hypothetical protein
MEKLGKSMVQKNLFNFFSRSSTSSPSSATTSEACSLASLNRSELSSPLNGRMNAWNLSKEDQIETDSSVASLQCKPRK